MKNIKYELHSVSKNNSPSANRCVRSKRGCVTTMLLCVFFLVACNSSSKDDKTTEPSDDDNSKPPSITIPENFFSVEATFDLDYTFSAQHIDVVPLLENPIRPGFAMMGMVEKEGQNLVGISHRVQSDETSLESDAYTLVDINTLTYSPLIQQTSASFSKDLSAAAWIEECQGYVLALQTSEVPVHINPYTRDNTCYRPASLSELGHTVIFGTARGQIGDDGTLYWAGFDSREFGPVIVYRPTCNNGELVAMRTAFLPNGAAEIGELEYTDGILLIEAASGEYTFIDRQQMVRAFCLKCYFYPADNMKLSGDGKYLFYMRPLDADLLNPMATSVLYRYDIANKTLKQIPIEDVIDDETLVIDHKGTNIGYVANGQPILLKLDTAERVNMDKAVRGCTDTSIPETCEFDSFRFVTNSPLAFSRDGSAMSIETIPEKDEMGSRQNLHEVMILDTQSLQVARMTPNTSVDRFQISEDGSLMLFQTLSGNLLPNDDDFDDDLFFVRR